MSSSLKNHSAEAFLDGCACVDRSRRQSRLCETLDGSQESQTNGPRAMGHLGSYVKTLGLTARR